MMNQRARPDRNVNGSVTQTLDVLDFSIIHLSWYERLQKRHSRIVRDALLKKQQSGDSTASAATDKVRVCVSRGMCVRCRAGALISPLVPCHVL